MTTILVLLIALMLAIIIAGVIFSQVTLFHRSAKTRDLASCAFEKTKYFSEDVSQLNEKIHYVAEQLDQLREQQSAVPEKPPDEDEDRKKKKIEDQYARMQEYHPADYGIKLGGADENYGR